MLLLELVLVVYLLNLLRQHTVHLLLLVLMNLLLMLELLLMLQLLRMLMLLLHQDMLLLLHLLLLRDGLSQDWPRRRYGRRGQTDNVGVSQELA